MLLRKNSYSNKVRSVSLEYNRFIKVKMREN
jgi:hypothetical protein